MSSPASLRDLYAPPPNAWKFAPPSANSTQPEVPVTGTSHQWTAPASNRLFELSASLAPHEDESGLDVSVVLKGLVASALLQYATTAVAIPWEVGKTLLQVQWVPRNADEMAHAVPAVIELEDEDAMSDTSNENESYFADPSSQSTPPPPRLVDERGYIIRQSVTDEDTIPEYIIPVGSASGTWGMMKRVGRFRSEGWLSLWKGLLTASMTEMLFSGLQPAVHTVLESLFSPVLSGIASPATPFGPPPVLLPIASQVVTGLILSPLDLVRTRLMVQSSVPQYRTYSGPIDALKQILEYEGGLNGVYFHPHLFFPAIVDCTLRSLVPLTVAPLIASYFSISADSNPVLWTATGLLGGCISLLITLPFETVRKRLQVQTRGTAKPLKACVELRPAPYHGIIDVFWHILTEERSDLPLKHKRRRRRSVNAKGKPTEETDDVHAESWLRNIGIGQLYRGLGMRLGATVCVLVLAVLNGRDEAEAGWAEL